MSRSSPSLPSLCKRTAHPWERGRRETAQIHCWKLLFSREARAVNHCRPPDKPPPPALHSCALRDNSFRCLSAQVQVWRGWGCAVCWESGSCAASEQTLPHGTQQHLWKGDGSEYICKSLCLQNLEINPTGEDVGFCC